MLELHLRVYANDIDGIAKASEERFANVNKLDGELSSEDIWFGQLELIQKRVRFWKVNIWLNMWS